MPGVPGPGGTWSQGVPGPGGAWSWGMPGGDPSLMATAVGSMHPTGMHFCLICF